MGNAASSASTKQPQRQAALKSKLQTAIFYPFKAGKLGWEITLCRAFLTSLRQRKLN
jgi:hypothetical protein